MFVYRATQRVVRAQSSWKAPRRRALEIQRGCARSRRRRTNLTAPCRPLRPVIYRCRVVLGASASEADLAVLPACSGLRAAFPGAPRTTHCTGAPCRNLRVFKDVMPCAGESLARRTNAWHAAWRRRLRGATLSRQGRHLRRHPGAPPSYARANGEALREASWWLRGALTEGSLPFSWWILVLLEIGSGHCRENKV